MIRKKIGLTRSMIPSHAKAVSASWPEVYVVFAIFAELIS